METLITRIADFSIGFAALSLLALTFYQTFRQERQEKKEKDSRQDELEKEFREYLIGQGKEHHEIIMRNTEAFERFSKVMEKQYQIMEQLLNRIK